MAIWLPNFTLLSALFVSFFLRGGDGEGFTWRDCPICKLAQLHSATQSKQSAPNLAAACEANVVVAVTLLLLLLLHANHLVDLRSQWVAAGPQSDVTCRLHVSSVYSWWIAIFGPAKKKIQFPVDWRLKQVDGGVCLLDLYSLYNPKVADKSACHCVGFLMWVAELYIYEVEERFLNTTYVAHIPCR